jgi:hypothetical protein
MEMNRKNAWLAGSVVLLAIIILVWGKSKPAPGPEGEEKMTPTRAAVPANAVVPNPSSTDLSPNLAIPKAELQAAPEAETKWRSFDISLDRNHFVPDTISVYQGDTVHVIVHAVDKNYDVSQPDYGFRLSIPKGGAKLLEFAAMNTGKFSLVCDACGGINAGAVGYIVVVPKN